jgi:tRNA threonylcarbamoyladenosine biosynthesis protein TsaE
MQRDYTLSDIESVARELLNQTPGRIFLFYGSMGVGKTTLIKALVKTLGVKDTVSSPTFSLVNEYRTNENKSVFHFDFYRINDEVEALDMGIEEYFDTDAYCFVEWPEKIINLLPLHAVSVSIKKIEGELRKIEVILH